MSRVTLLTPVLSVSKPCVPRLSIVAAHRLAKAVAQISAKPDAAQSNVEDLLSYLPIRYEDRSNLARIAGLRPGIEASLELYVRVSGGFRVGRKRSRKQPPLYIFEITAGDPERTGKPVVVWWFVSGPQAWSIITFNRKRFERGTRFVAFGKWEWDSRRNTFALKINRSDELEVLAGKNSVPEASLLRIADEPQEGASNALTEAGAKIEESPSSDEDQSDPDLALIHVGRRVPVYRKLGEFTGKRLREINYSVTRCLAKEENEITLPEDLVKQHDLISRTEAFRRIHFPDDNAPLASYEMACSPAHTRLIFEEFFWFSFALALRKKERFKETKGFTISIPDAVKQKLSGILNFKLTGAQKRVLREIFEDMGSNAPMNRLLQGDVGSGKTAVALLAMVAAIENGYQTALLAPTEILAEQHARNFITLLSPKSYRVELLTGSMKAGEKRRVHQAIAQGEAQACIGTHALIQEGVSFNRLGLAVIDEQHRFGVLQRAAVRELGSNPDVLVMTATPIPRSLAMTVYGELDVSVIDEMPPGRSAIKTVVVGEDRRQGVYKGVERELRTGAQVYIVYPLVEESEKIDLKDATRMYEHLRDQVFTRYSVGLVHGRMKAGEKEKVMGGFARGDVQVLVATTVVEVGVDVPNASVMVIEHAERFGLSQLHQLRGRVGRGARKSFCVLMASDEQTSVARERLGIMEETSDGFRIAEKDLEIRGPGEMMGTRQSGIPEFRFGNLVRDLTLLEQARESAGHYLTALRDTKETAVLIKRTLANARFGLAEIG